MELWIFCWLIMLVIADRAEHKDKNKSKKKARKSRRNDDWLNAAWFHDHGQSI